MRTLRLEYIWLKDKILTDNLFDLSSTSHVTWTEEMGASKLIRAPIHQKVFLVGDARELIRRRHNYKESNLGIKEEKMDNRKSCFFFFHPPPPTQKNPTRSSSSIYCSYWYLYFLLKATGLRPNKTTTVLLMMEVLYVYGMVWFQGILL